MRIVIFGGSFNPPHKGHLNASLVVSKVFRPDLFLVIPGYQPPHKLLSADAPTPEKRLELCRLCFAAVPNLLVSDLEIQRGGKSYTSDTIRALREEYPEAELVLTVGSDMLRTLETWHESDYLLRTVTVAAVARQKGELSAMRDRAEHLKKSRGAKIRILEAKPFPASSTDVRAALRSRGGLRLLEEPVYREIVKHRLYGVQVNFRWLRKRGYAMLKNARISHVRGCEEEAVRLAERWGADADKAAEAAILHDCTKREDLAGQLRLCEKYGIIPDEMERTSGKLLHSKTGAAIAEQEFGMDADVVSAIRWHTTGKADMTLLEKVLYMADYIEPTRDFDGVDQLRKLAYRDLDRAMLLGFEMSRDEIMERGETPHVNTLAAIRWYRENLTP